MNDYQRSYRQLNELQKKCVDTTDGPLLILAGPGTGKTQLLSVRAGSIVENKRAEPENILILTYTNSAAKNMKERLAKVMGRSGYDVEVSTFHGFANSIIQESEEAVNYVGDKIQMDDVERMRVMEYILNNTKGLEDIRPFGSPYNYLKEMLGTISNLKRDGVKAADLKKYLASKKSLYHEMEEKYRARLKAFSVVYERYEELKEGRDRNIFDERGRYDFDDMIIYATQAITEEPLLKKEYQKQYLYAMVDEYQDTNGSQLELLFALFDQKSPNICFVGDDDQSIYRFQGASVDNFKLLENRFPDLRTISLKDNYRSSKDLIEISRSLISTMIPITERASDKPLEAKKSYTDKQIFFREFTTEEEELLFLVDKVKELKERILRDENIDEEERKHPYNSIAILVRKRKDILKIIDAFLQAGIPYATDGKEDISGEKRVRQLLDVLDLISIDPQDTASKDLALYKVISSDYFRLDHSDILKFLNTINNMRKTDPSVTFLSQMIEYADRSQPAVKFSDDKRMHKTARVIKSLLKDADTKSVHTILTQFLKDSGLYGYVLEQYSDKSILKIRQLRALGSFINMIKSSDLSNPSIRLKDFMMEMKTREEHGLPVQGDLVTMTQEGVRIYTAHGSKGLEFRSVIIPFCLHNRNWPARTWPERIKLPPDLIKTKRASDDKDRIKDLSLQDEARLFYVAMTRAKSDLIFTASPTENNISSLYLSKLDMEREFPQEASRDTEEELIEKSLETTDLKDPFIGTEKVLLDMISNMSLNPTRLNTYLYCKRKFLYNDVIRLPGAKKKSLVFGNCVHKALEDTYRKYMTSKKFPSFDFFREAFKRELKFQGMNSAMERELSEKMERTAPWYEKASKAPVMPLSLEKKLVVTIGDNIIFTGKYDKVEWYDEKKKLVKIIDYKTGKPDKHIKAIKPDSSISDPECDGYLRQLVGYRLLFERDKSQSKGRRVAAGELVFIEPIAEDIKKLGYKKGDIAVKSVEITNDMLDELETLIKNSWNDIQRLRFEKLSVRDDSKCGNCDFDPICWGADNE